MQRTDLRVMKTLKQIDGALLSFLADTPYDKITVDQLCRETMINRSTFYKYYTGKHDLMERFLRRAPEGFRRQVDVAFVEASPETIQDLVYRRSFENTLHFLFRHKAEYELLWSLPLQDGVFGRMIQIVHDAILDKLAAGETIYPYADLYACLFASDMMTMVRWWFQYKERVSAKEVQELMCRNMKQGMFRTFRERMC